jgi:hypothetical protein
MTEIDYRNWRRRTYAVAAKRAGLRTQRPYDLRHAFVSLLIAEGRSVVEVAAQAGHAPTMTLDTYAHVIAELEGAERRPAEELISEVRTMLASPAQPAETRFAQRTTPTFGVRVLYARRGFAGQAPLFEDEEHGDLQALPTKPSQGLEPWTPSLPWRCSTTELRGRNGSQSNPRRSLQTPNGAQRARRRTISSAHSATRSRSCVRR